MLTEDRFHRILEIIEENGSATVQELMQELDASESTIRRDLNTLHAREQLMKVHGGAVSLNKVCSTTDFNMDFRKNRNREEKILIAKYAASLIEPGDFVFLDAGTTTEYMIEFLSEKNVVFVTNAIGHAQKLSTAGYTTYILGGEYKAATEAVVGDEAVASLEKYNFTKGFWGTNGVSLEKGFSTPEVKEAMIKKVAMNNCVDCYVLCDRSKFSQISCVSFAEFGDATIITTKVENEKFRNCKNVLEVSRK